MSDSLSTALTAAIAASAGFQALFSGLLWRLQHSIESQRKKTSVSVSFELRRPDQSKPLQGWVRVENASETGVYHTHLDCMMKSQTGKKHGPVRLDLRMSIPPWGSREKEITGVFLSEAMKADATDTAMTGSARAVEVIFRPHYKAAQKEMKGWTSVYHVEFSGHNFQRAELTNEHEGFIEFL